MAAMEQENGDGEDRGDGDYEEDAAHDLEPDRDDGDPVAGSPHPASKKRKKKKRR